MTLANMGLATAIEIVKNGEASDENEAGFNHPMVRDAIETLVAFCECESAWLLIEALGR